MFQWIFYVLVISVVLSISAVFAEQALRRRHLPTRMVWLIALSGCVWLSFLALSVSSASVTTASNEQQTTSSVRAVAPIRLPDVAHAGTIVVRTIAGLLGAADWEREVLQRALRNDRGKQQADFRCGHRISSLTLQSPLFLLLLLVPNCYWGITRGLRRATRAQIASAVR